MVTETPKPRTLSSNFYRLGYIAFVLAGIYFASKGKYADAAMYGGLALVFDPFDTTVPFNKRALYQKGILLVHLALTFLFFGLALMK
jgi:hypothetical protein